MEKKQTKHDIIIRRLGILQLMFYTSLLINLMLLIIVIYSNIDVRDSFISIMQKQVKINDNVLKAFKDLQSSKQGNFRVDTFKVDSAITFDTIDRYKIIPKERINQIDKDTKFIRYESR